MDDWISRPFVAFWIVLTVIGTLIGSVFLSGTFGPLGGLAAGAIAGAGSALIISANRYIGSTHHEDDARPH